MRIRRFVSGTLADLVLKFPQAWGSAASRPDAAICTVQYDFDTYYKSRINPIQGFTKTKADPAIVRAWKVERNVAGSIALSSLGTQGLAGLETVLWRSAAGMLPAWGGGLLRLHSAG